MGLKKQVTTLNDASYKNPTLKTEYRRLYKEAVKGTMVNPKKVIFLELRENGLSDTFKELYKALEARGDYELKVLCTREITGDPAEVQENCTKAIPEMVDAAWILINDASYFISALRLRKATKVIQLWHDCGVYEKFGFSLVDEETGEPDPDLRTYPIHRNMHYVMTSGLDVRSSYVEALRKQKFRVQATGSSHTDAYYDPENITAARQAVESYLEKQGLPAMEDDRKRKILLYAPTYRGEAAQAAAPDMPDFAGMHDALGEEWVFLCSHHLFVQNRPAVGEDCGTYTFDVTGQLSMQQLLMASDVCVSDYSSVIFEYSLLGRPMLFLRHDHEQYMENHEFYYSVEELTPGPTARSTEELIELLLHLDEWLNEEQILKFRKKFVGRCDGQATERILQTIDRYGYKPKVVEETEESDDTDEDQNDSENA